MNRALVASGRPGMAFLFGALLVIGCDGGASDGARIVAPGGPAARARTTPALHSGVDRARLNALTASLPANEAAVVRRAFERGGTPGRLHSTNPRTEARLAELYSSMEAHRAAESSRSKDLWDRPLTIVYDEHATQLQVLRGFGELQGDAVVLGPAQLNAPALSAGVRALGRLRARERDAARPVRAVINPKAFPPSAPDEWTQYLEQRIRDLKASEVQDVPGVGRARMLRLARLGAK